MASSSQCLASLARLSLSTPLRNPAISLPRFLVPSIASQCRFASGGGSKKKDTKKKKKHHKTFKVWDKADLVKYSLCDAIRYEDSCYHSSSCAVDLRS